MVNMNGMQKEEWFIGRIETPAGIMLTDGLNMMG